MDSLLRVQGLGFRPKGSSSDSREEQFFLLKDLNFSLEKGGLFAVTGPSGSGKSTLLQLLCRLLEPSEGEVFYGGRSYRDYDPKQLRREITLVFQTPTLIGPTVMEDLFLGLTFSQTPSKKSLPNSQEWAKRLLRRLHLEDDILKKNPGQLSVGEAQRIALARALVIQPKILLLDEPTASLDVKSKTAIEEALKEELEEGLTVILVSHEPRQIQELAQHGIELKNGKVINQW